MPLIRLALLAALAASSPAQATQAVGPLAPPGAPAASFPPPDRPVAEIVSPIWASEAERDAVGEAAAVIRLMGIGPGARVADIGAGTGYYTVRLSRAVGPEGRVLAQDVTPAYLRDLVRRVAGEGLKNVTLGLGEPHDPRLPAGSADVALLIHMYHEIGSPYAFLHNLAAGLGPGGRVGIVDLDRPTWQHGTPRDLLRCELSAAGYREAAFHSLEGKVGYLAVFEAPAPEARPEPGAIRPCRAGRP